MAVGLVLTMVTAAANYYVLLRVPPTMRTSTEYGVGSSNQTLRISIHCWWVLRAYEHVLPPMYLLVEYPYSNSKPSASRDSTCHFHLPP